MEDTLTASNVVQETTNYDQFSFIEANRETSRGHIELLKKAFEEIGNLTKAQPILVNSRMQIIDGQHRFTACRELGLPIYYVVVPRLGVAEARVMNILHRGWGMDDYVRSYALSGDRNYQRYLKLKEDYGFNHSILMAYAKNDGMRKGTFREFHNGDFTFSEEEELMAREHLDKLAEVVEVNKIAVTRNMGIALLKAMQVEDLDWNKMVHRIKLHPSMVKRQVSTGEALRMLEEIYNYRVTEANHLRLF